MAGDVGWEALDLHFTQHVLQHSALALDADWHADELDRHRDAHGFVHGDALEINGAIHVSDLPHSGSIKFLGDEHATVAHVTAIREEVVEPEAVAATTAAEPEVAKKGKGDADAAPAAEAKPEAKKK